MSVNEKIKNLLNKFGKAKRQRPPEIQDSENTPDHLSPYREKKNYIDWARMNPKQVNKVRDKIRNDYKELEKYRSAVNKIKQEIAGNLFFKNGAPKPVPHNKIGQMINVYTRMLASGTPQLSIEANYDELMPFAKKFELRCNRHYREIRLEEIFNDGVIEGMCGVCVSKTGLAEGDELFEIDGHMYDPGKPFTDIIRIDDFVIDMQSTNKADVEMIGDRCLRPRSWVKQQYDMNGIKLSAEDMESLGAKDSKDGEVRNENERVGGAKEDPENRLSDDIWVWNIFCPKWNLVMEIPDGYDMPFCVKEWDGPEHGPYDFIGFIWPADFVLPIPPVSQIYDLHELTNMLARKLGRQALDQKTVPFVEAGHEGEMEKIRLADDREVAVIAPGAKEYMGQMDFPGADPGVQQWNAWNLQQIDDAAGGMQMMAGIGPASETASQDKMIASQQNMLLDTMRQRTLKWATSVMKKHAWYLWTDPIREAEVVKVVDNLPDGLIIRIPVKFTPEEREGDFLDYNFSIEPYSIKDETPQEKLQKYNFFLQNYVMPFQELIMQNGMTIDFMELYRLVGDLMNIKTEKIVKMMDPETAEMMAQFTQVGQIAAPARFKQSHTVNERISRPGTSPRNSQVNMAAAFPQQGNQRQGGITTVGAGQ